MNQLLPILLSLSALSYGLEPACPEYRFEYVGKPVTGEEKSLPDFPACVTHCQGLAKCKYFHYDVDSQLCKPLETAKGRIGNRNAMAGTKDCAALKVPDREYGVDYGGNDVGSMKRVKCLEDCQDYCDKLDVCKFFSYEITGYCWPKNQYAVMDVTERKSDFDVISGRKKQ